MHILLFLVHVLVLRVFVFILVVVRLHFCLFLLD